MSPHCFMLNSAAPHLLLYSSFTNLVGVERECFFPINECLCAVSTFICDVACMLKYRGIFSRFVGKEQSLVHVNACLVIVAFKIKYPCVGVEIGGIVALCLYGSTTHLLGFVKVFAFER